MSDRLRQISLWIERKVTLVCVCVCVVFNNSVSSMSFGREDPGMNQLHQQMKSYLTQEEEAMEHRIR